MADPTLSRRRFLSAGAATAAAVAAGGALLPACSLQQGASEDPANDLARHESFGGSLVSPPLAKPDVTLTTMDGRPFHFRSETAGKLTLLYFGYTNCPDQCPVYLSTVSAARNAVGVGPGSRPQVLFIGIDLKRDTPARLKQYLGAIDPTFIGLTGTKEQIDKANGDLHFAPIEIGTPNSKGEYLVGHQSQAVFFTPDDKGHRLYGWDTRQAQLVKDLPRLARGVYK